MSDDSGLQYWQTVGQYEQYHSVNYQQGANDMLLKETGGGEFENPEPGAHPAVCYKIIDIGTQQGEYQGVPNSKRQVIIGFELAELMSDGRPFVVSQFYTASLSEKATLRHHLEGWRGRAFTSEELMGFDAKALIDKPCLISLVKSDKGRIKINGIMRMPKGMEPPKRQNEVSYLSLEREEFDASVFNKLSDKMRLMIAKSPEYMTTQETAAREIAASKGRIEDMESDVPF